MLTVKKIEVDADSSVCMKNNIFLVYNEGEEAAVIDAANAKSYKTGGAVPEIILEESAGNIEETARRLGKRVTAVLLTHGHWDHVGDAKAWQERGAKVYIGKEDAARLTVEEIERGRNRIRIRATHADETVTDGDEIAVGSMKFLVIATPGHTEGSCTFRIENNLFTGDTLFSDDFGRYDLPGGDFSALKRSLTKLFALDGDFNVFPGHEESTTLGKERKSNAILDYLGGGN